MFKRAIWALAVVVYLAAPAKVQAQGDYLDVFMVKVKPEKVADFEALTKKWADANRRFNGDHWVAMETMYGEGNVYTFVSPRQDYADIEKVSDLGMRAATKAFGKEAADKMIRDFQNCLVWSRSELRRRRTDLSRKPPTDMASYAKLIGESRVLRTTAVHVRPGRVAEFEAQLKELEQAGEKNPDARPVLVSQAVEGTKGTTFYITTLRSSLAGFDKNPTGRELLGEEGYRKFQQSNAENVEGAESSLNRFSAELSNPAEEIARVASDFWTPKALAASAAKPKAAAASAKAPTTAEAKATSDKPRK
jgi:hypothetical protein